MGVPAKNLHRHWVYDEFCDKVNILMVSRRIDHKDLVILLGKAVPSYVIREVQLKRYLGSVANSSVDIPFLLVIAVADVFKVPLNYFDNSQYNESAYTRALLAATAGKMNPLFYVAGQYPSYALMPHEIAKSIHRWCLGMHGPLVDRYDYLAATVRRQFTEAEETYKAQHVNYVSKKGFLELFDRCREPTALAKEADGYLTQLQSHLSHNTVTEPNKKSLRFELYLVDDTLLGNLDTKVLAVNKISSSRFKDNPGILRWSEELAEVEEAIVYMERLHDDVRTMKVSINYLESMRSDMAR